MQVDVEPRPSLGVSLVDCGYVGLGFGYAVVPKAPVIACAPVSVLGSALRPHATVDT